MKAKGRPKGYWLGIEIPFDGDKWNIDCWFIRREWLDPEETTKYQKKLENISTEQRDAILVIKHWLITNGLYGKKFYSDDVYDSVVSASVLSIEDFMSHFKLSI